jgi:hypothetical protein
MEHRVAEENNAVERYLLGEFGEQERRDFEEHLFDCTICGERVRESAVVIDNLKEVLREEPRGVPERRHERSRGRDWRDWLRLPVLAPSLIAVALASVVGYQNWVYIPALERPQVLSSAVIAPLAREQPPVITTDPQNPKFNVNFAVDVPQPYPDYVCEFRKENGASIVNVDSGPHEVASFTLGIALPTKEFPPGRYVMVLRPASAPQAELQRYSFIIQQGAQR